MTEYCAYCIVTVLRNVIFDVTFTPLRGYHLSWRLAQVRVAELSSDGVCHRTRRVARHHGAAHKVCNSLESHASTVQYVRANASASTCIARDDRRRASSAAQRRRGRGDLPGGPAHQQTGKVCALLQSTPIRFIQYILLSDFSLLPFTRVLYP